MRVLLTGATGLIGKEVGKILVQNGHEVIALSRNPQKARLELPFPARIFEWAGDHAPMPTEALNNVEGVIHLAGESIAGSRWTEEKKRRIRDSRVDGTRRLVESLKASPQSQLKVFVSGSAVGYYGNREDAITTEDSELDQKRIASDFLAQVVHDWEKEADQLIEGEPFKTVRLAKVRTGVVLSRREGALAQMLSLFTKGLGGQLGNGQQWMSWIHIKDIARLFVFCLEDEKVHGVLNGVAPEPAKNERFTIELARSLGRPVFLPVPAVALKLAVGDLADVLLEGQRVLPARAQELGFEFQFPELVGALRELGEPLQFGQHELVTEQWIPALPEKVFPFFCDEMNLERLTPPTLNFEVLGKSTPQIREGTLIEYKLKIRRVPVKWKTLIEEWVPGKRFVDTQLKGPYRKWRHTHEFIEMAGGTLLRDRVLYQLPLGFVGDTVGGWKVATEVEEVFKYRRKVIGETFGHS